MNYSNNYIFYPVNPALEHTITHSLDMLSDEAAKSASPDNTVTVADNFLNTRGPYEQHRYSSSVLQPLREVLETAIANDSVKGISREQDPVAWAQAQNKLGNILAALAQQQSDAGLYEKAISCFNQALEELDQKESPFDWAATQNNLGTAQQALGQQLKSAKFYNASVDAYTNATLIWSRKETPDEWAFTMHQLGATLHAYGKTLKGDRNFEKSVVAYRNALAELDADNHAFRLVAVHNNCGAVLQHLGESEENTARIEEAVKAYETALTVCMEQQLPFHLAVLCRVNKATALSVLAELKKDATLAEEVADEFELILECFPHALQPLCVKHCEAQLDKTRSFSF